MQHSAIGGIFVGGAARRMGGRPKELLRTASGETLRERWERLFAEVGVPVVLVGGREPGALIDEGTDAGPLGGIAALLAHTVRVGAGHAITVAGDMPFVSRVLLERLLAAPAATVVAARREGRWEPFLARWDAQRALPVVRARLAANQRALQGALDALGAAELALSSEETAQLVDWDTPADVDVPQPEPEKG